MRKTILIGIITIVAFLLQFVIFNVFDGRFDPDLLLLVVVFFTLFRGVRYGLVSALFGGILSDSFHSGIFGLHIFTLTICVYIAVLVRMYLYRGEGGPGAFLAFIMTIIKVCADYSIMVMFMPVDFYDMVIHIMVPKVFATTIVSVFVFNLLRQCVLKLSE